MVELLIAIGLMAVLLPALLTGLVSSRQGKAQQLQRIQAVSLLKEAEEAVRSIRNADWNSIATNGTYYPQISGSNWGLAAGIENMSGDLLGFTRQIDIGDTYRDSNGNIVSIGGSLDRSTKKVITTVTWNKPYLSSVSSTVYLTRFNNSAYVQTTEADFNLGTKDGTTVTHITGGEVILGAGGNGDWCRPNDFILSGFTLPQIGNALTATEGAAFIASGNGTPSNISFMKLLISNPPSPAPPVPSVEATYISDYQTNGVFGEGDYTYLATNDPTDSVSILQRSGSTYNKIGALNLPDHTPAYGVFVKNNIAYVTTDHRLYTFNVSTKTGNHSYYGRAYLWFTLGTSKQVTVVGNYAYVGVSGTLLGLQIFNISNPQSPSLTSATSLTLFQEPRGIYADPTGSRAYIAFMSNEWWKGGFYIYNVTNKSRPSYLGQYRTNGMDPRGIAVVPGNKAIIVGVGGNQYQVANLIPESSPSECGHLSLSDNVYGVATALEQDGDAYSYIIWGGASDQFKIIQGGPGGRYALNGTFESSPFTSPTGNPLAFNKFTATVFIPVSTEIKIQVAVSDYTSGSCSDALYKFLGPDGTDSSYYTINNDKIEGLIPLTTNGNYNNPGRCFKYKAFLSTTDANSTPELDEVNINYSL